LIAKTGEPVEFVLAHGSYNDCRVLKQFQIDLPAGSTIDADGSYNDYHYEDLLKELGINFKPIRKKDSKRAVSLWVEYVRKSVRQRVETAASQITGLFPKAIHAVTAQGFELKIVLFIIAFGIPCL